MELGQNNYLIAAAVCCVLAALAHAGCILFGADWYRFFGAGEAMAQMAEKKLWYPTVLTAGITAVLLIWAAYALAGAGVLSALPLTRTALILISAVFLLRGLAFVWLMPKFPENSLTFWWVSSSICLVIGSLFAIGTVQRWQVLSSSA